MRFTEPDTGLPRIYVWSTDGHAVWYHKGAPVRLTDGSTVYQPACSGRMLERSAFGLDPGDVPQLRRCERCLRDEIAEERRRDMQQGILFINERFRDNRRLRRYLRSLLHQGWTPATVWWLYTLWYDRGNHYLREHGEIWEERNQVYVYTCLRDQNRRQRFDPAPVWPFEEVGPVGATGPATG
jgi:hypothetical protein